MMKYIDIHYGFYNSFCEYERELEYSRLMENDLSAINWNK